MILYEKKEIVTYIIVTDCSNYFEVEIFFETAR